VLGQECVPVFLVFLAQDVKERLVTFHVKMAEDALAQINVLARMVTLVKCVKQHDAIGVVTMAALAFVPMSAHVRMVILDTTAEREPINVLEMSFTDEEESCAACRKFRHLL